MIRSIFLQATAASAFAICLLAIAPTAQADAYSETALLTDEELYGAESSLTPDALANQRPLLLIHGIHGNREPDCGVDDPKDLIERPNRAYWERFHTYLATVSGLAEKYKLYHFHYVSDRRPVKEIAGALARRISERFGTTPVTIVAHSMGGLVARSYMEEHGGGERVRLLITLGTPHHGTPLANEQPRVVGPGLDGVWEGVLDVVDADYWGNGSRLVGAFFFQNEPNRSDLRWDDFDGEWRTRNGANGERNDWLRALPRTYNNRIIAYWGQIGSDEATASLQNLGPSGISGYLEATKGTCSDHLALRGLGTLLERILLQAYEADRPVSIVSSDGMVPLFSGAFVQTRNEEGYSPLRRVTRCDGYDHLDLLEGSDRPCANGLKLFDSVALDLGLTPNPGPTPERPEISAVTNSASYFSEWVAPGELVTIFGDHLGPENPVPAEPVGGVYPTSVGGIQVAFDEMAAPIYYVSANQTIAIVPAGLAGRGQVRVRVRSGISESEPFGVRVGLAAPGFFSQDSSGAGQAAMIHQNGSLNSSENPASNGSIVSFYGTGAGLFESHPVDGDTWDMRALRSTQPATVRIGGVYAPVLYAGAAPGLPGVFQINAVTPEGAASGPSVPVVATFGGLTSQAGLTMAVAGAPPAGDIDVTGYWDYSETYGDGSVQLIQWLLKQNGAQVTGLGTDVYLSYSSRRGSSAHMGSISGTTLRTSHRRTTTQSQVPDVTRQDVGEIGPNDMIYGTTTSFFDSGGESSHPFNATKRVLRANEYEVAGEIRNPGDRMHFAFWAPALTEVSAEVIARRTGSGIDPLLTLLEADGESQVRESDDTFGRDPAILGYKLTGGSTESQVYYLRVRDYSSATGPFRLRVRLAGARKDLITAPRVATPAVVQGRIDFAGEADIYRVDLETGKNFEARVTVSSYSSLLFPVVKLLGPDGTTEVATLEEEQLFEKDVALRFRAPKTATYFLVVQDVAPTGWRNNFDYILSTHWSAGTALHEESRKASDNSLSTLPLTQKK